MSAPLYNRDILALAVGLAAFPRLPAAQFSGDRRAPLCGSRVTMDMDIDASGQIAAIGLAVEACALGQAAATLLARAVAGRTAQDLAIDRDRLTDWLSKASDTPPDWPGIAALAAARDYPARHAAIILPFALAAELAPSAQNEQAA